MTRIRKLFTFPIDAELSEGLRRVKDRDGIGISEQIRRAIRSWLKRKGVIKRKRKQAATRKRS
jgi:ribbon-helix-helix CopG family protein